MFARKSRARHDSCASFPFDAFPQPADSSVTDTNRDSSLAREAAEYIATLAQELATMAAAQRLDLLRYLLEMARDEARMIALERLQRPEDR